MARAGIPDVFVINEVVGAEKVRALALLAREAKREGGGRRRLPRSTCCRPPRSRPGARSASSSTWTRACIAAASRPPRRRCPLARRIAAAPGLAFLGPDRLRGPLLAGVRRREAPRHGPRGDGPADRHREPARRRGPPVPDGVGRRDGHLGGHLPVSRRDGDPAGLLRHHGRPPSRPRPALRLGHDGAGVGDQPAGRPHRPRRRQQVGRRVARRPQGLGPREVYRFDEEHSIFLADATCPLDVGDTVEILCNYTPFAVGYFEAYHVIEDDRVVDVWPVMPRGPESRWLLDLLERGG